MFNWTRVLADYLAKKDGVAIPLIVTEFHLKTGPTKWSNAQPEVLHLFFWNLGVGRPSTSERGSAKWGMVSYWIYHINHPMVDCLFGSVDWNLNNHPRHPGWAASTTKRRGLETPWTSEETSEHVESWIPNLWLEISWWNVMFPCQYYKMESMRMLNIKADGHSNFHILLVPHQSISFAIFTVHPWVTWYL